ncbi:MAG: MgtC/SapB family protein [Chloroflexi bacterium]|nr:MgtC/SapB family protein [Ktedonobacteraceae bacterium]MBV9022019.1 MgtC/SapB family protein [Ktedonobacteraceae bacterium]MBV9708697.1 MgtC/SapB family protein [Chloroflexota bacterium]
MTLFVEFVLRLSAALGCGFLIGIERQYRQRTAGLRTSALVATGSALFVLVAALTPNESSPTRIAAQVVSGVGFLCAGVIIRDGLNIRGLNTAGTLWCASGVGVLAGSGYFVPAILGSLIVLIANLLLRPIGRFISHHSKASGELGEAPVRYRLAVVCVSTQETHIRSLLLQAMSGSDLLLQALQSEDTEDASNVEVKAAVQTEGRKDAQLEQIIARLSLESSVSAVRWEVAAPENGGVSSLLSVQSDVPDKEEEGARE